MEKLMAAKKIESTEGWYDTPTGWLAKYLEKTGPGTLFDGTNMNEYTRAKKK
jgi:hypothetical protein